MQDFTRLIRNKALTFTEFSPKKPLQRDYSELNNKKAENNECECRPDKPHQRIYRENFKAMNRVRSAYITGREPIGRKRELFGLFRKLQTYGNYVEIELALDWLAENGLPGSRQKCLDPLQYLAAGAFPAILAAARREFEVMARHRVERAVTIELQTEFERARNAERELLDLFYREFSTPSERSSAIDREIAREPGISPELAVARIAIRLKDAAPVLAREIRKLAG